jgi:hypothetical protein
MMFVYEPGKILAHEWCTDKKLPRFQIDAIDAEQ